MIINVSLNPHQIKSNTTITVDYQDAKQFPLLNIDCDSYIVSAEIQSGINFDDKNIAHNFQIGKYCSMADKIKFMIGLNHDYKSVTTGECSFLNSRKASFKIKQKNQIIIQNDVWIGSGATIMSGVIIHNGAVVAANSHVIKDVPPYAIVGGNPAELIGYRFNDEQIEKLQRISWWHWDIQKLEQKKEYFEQNIDDFINKFYPEVFQESVDLINYQGQRPVYLFFSDVHEKYSVTEHVINEYYKNLIVDGNELLLIYLDEDQNTEKSIDEIDSIIKNVGLRNDNNILLQVGGVHNEKSLFSIADYYITTRAKETIRRTCYADEFGVKILSGVDSPIF